MSGIVQGNLTDGTMSEIGLDDEQAWWGVLSRDPLMDNQFVYAVRTTGIFCRPTCPSRRPKRQNVSFFPTPTEAEAAGYRACRRCMPSDDADANPSTKLVERMQSFIADNIDRRVTLETIGKHVGLSPWHVQRTFKKTTGMSPREYLVMKRTERLKAELRNGNTVSRAIYEAGFNSSSVVYESSSDQLGMTPAAYKNGGLGVDIQFAIVPSRIGKVMVAATERGVCNVTIGDDDERLEESLRAEFPNANIDQAHGGLEDWTDNIRNYISGGTREIGFPLDVGGTPFQQKVWHALQQIPYGATRTYKDIAQSLGAPRSVRAVANACAGNRAALAIPCHRVVRSDGTLGGYKWGLERKKRILETEQRVPVETP